MRLQSSCWLGLSLIWRLIWWRWGVKNHRQAHSHGCQQASAPCCVGFSTDLPHSMAAGFCQGEWFKKEQRMPKIKSIAFHNFISKVTSCHLCILVLRSDSLSPAHIQEAMVAELYKDMKTRRQKPLGAILEGTDHKLHKAWLIPVIGKKSIKFISGAIREIWIWIW